MNQRGKQVSKAKKKALQRIGYPQMKRCVERFVADMESSGRDRRYWMHGSTFFNSGYVDYLDENYGDGCNGTEAAEQDVPLPDGDLVEDEEWWKYGPNGMEG